MLLLLMSKFDLDWEVFGYHLLCLNAAGCFFHLLPKFSPTHSFFVGVVCFLVIPKYDSGPRIKGTARI